MTEINENNAHNIVHNIVHNRGLIHESGELSSRAKGDENIRLAAQWLAYFGYSTPHIICTMLGLSAASAHRICNRLLKGDWARLVESPGQIDGFSKKVKKKDPSTGKIITVTTPPCVFVATPRSKNEVIAFIDFDLPKGISSTSAANLFHDLSAQRYCAQLIHAKPSYIYRSAHYVRTCMIPDPNALYAQNTPLSEQTRMTHRFSKKYDFVLESPNHVYGYEVEFSRKDPNHELFPDFNSILWDLTEGRVQFVIYVFQTNSDLKALYEVYRANYLKTLDDAERYDLFANKVLFKDYDFHGARYK